MFVRSQVIKFENYLNEKMSDSSRHSKFQPSIFTNGYTHANARPQNGRRRHVSASSRLLVNGFHNSVNGVTNNGSYNGMSNGGGGHNGLTNVYQNNKRTYCLSDLIQDLNSDSVIQYLQDNPQILEQYIVNNVPIHLLENWLLTKRKSAKKKFRNGEYNGRDSSPFRASIEQKQGKERRQYIQKLLDNVHEKGNQVRLLEELASSVGKAIQADVFNLYLTNQDGQAINFVSSTSKERPLNFQLSHTVGPGQTLAAYTAYSKKCVRVQDSVSEKHPFGVNCLEEPVHAVLSQPILDAEGNAVGVAEFCRVGSRSPFTETDEQISSSIILWGSIASHCTELQTDVARQRKLNDFLLEVTKNIFQNIVSMDSVIVKIMDYAKKLVKADRASLFLVDSNTKELYARIFDTGTSNHDTSPCAKEIRFKMTVGLAGHVARTGETLNITDAYMDERFNRDVDMKTGYKTKTVLCMPIEIQGKILGVVQMVNKVQGTFTRTDEESFETFAVYCGLALYHAKLYDKIRKSEQKYKVALEVLSYHNQCSDDEYKSLRDMKMLSKTKEVAQIPRFDFSPWSVEEERKSLHVVYMFEDLFGLDKFCASKLSRFTLTVKKNYRNVPYHNWDHAFSVAHAMYCILKTQQHHFNELEAIALYVACLCHDLDHRGKTNAFMVKSESPLAAIYTTSVMEHHHFNQTVSILQQDNHNIFKDMTSDEYKTVLRYIKECILATDLALFFGNKAKLREWADSQKFDWKNSEHRQALMYHSMTAADLCSMYKPWPVCTQLVHVIMEEFWQQGDEEKKQGNTPIAMMDRDKADQLPESQVGFIVGICLPCYELLSNIMPATKPMVEGAMNNLTKWQELYENNKTRKEQLKELPSSSTDENGNEKTTATSER